VVVGNKKSTQTGNMDGQNIDHEPCTSVHALQIKLIISKRENRTQNFYIFNTTICIIL
jgi:hypothetical protein